MHEKHTSACMRNSPLAIYRAVYHTLMHILCATGLVHLQYLQAVYMHQLKRTKAEEEERIAAVLQQRMRESERSAKELQQLRNESAELRDLQVSPICPNLRCSNAD